MADNSKHFRQLKADIRKLKRLLPRPDAFGSYSPLEVYRMVSFRVLSHSALEHYFENLSTEILDTSLERWRARGLVDPYLLSLCFRYSRMVDKKEGDANAPKFNEPNFFGLQRSNVSELVQMAADWQREKIKDNHGIKEKNVVDLFVPYGNKLFKHFEKLGEVLDPYGGIRGEYAHVSISKITKTPNPSDESSAIDDILARIESVDEFVVQNVLGIAKRSRRSAGGATPVALVEPALQVAQ